MHRRGAGVGAIKNKTAVQAKFKDKGTELASQQLAEMSSQMEIFKKNLEEFATKYREEIKKNSKFRSQFQEMCATIGVDPLTSSKGFWCKLLGVGDFYYELSVQIVEVCLATSHRNGGIMKLDELRTKLNISRGRNKQEVTNEDIMTAIRTMKVLGNGFRVLALDNNGQYLIQSIPAELNMDHMTIIKEAHEKSYVTVGELSGKLKWDTLRVEQALDFLVLEGLVWLDEQSAVETQYWFPGLFHERRKE
ncbi:hypothetical protein HELRODRAFT_154629 [Helobdella robusta]|uniref:Vacuolar-sorting protein SNF8 n=1 Tax=Helobdella robusta TaxID=6412 RepID=T1ELF4_HELRO|nr:hypothetical protein HELRODRAFT_154629 [Helobdella robusta]ESO07312.1 hypothetical protein HELRODRAFT_154629 [Helobdella robusta]